MIRKLVYIIFMIMVFMVSGCIKETYDLNKLTSKVHLTPTLAIGAINGDVSLSDIVEPNDTLVFDQNNLIKIVFKQDSVVNLTFSDFFSFKKSIDLKGNNRVLPDNKYPGAVSDFEKGLGQMIANIEPETFSIEIEDILSSITGDIFIPNPTIKLYYSNSFSFPIKLQLDATGKRRNKTPVDLDLDTLTLFITNPPDQPNIIDSIKIDSTNSNLADLISLPPEEILFSGTALMDTLSTKDRKGSYPSTDGRIIGSLEIEVPIEFSMNLQFADTLDNFLSDIFDEGSDFNWDDFDSFEMDFTVENGFPMEVSLSMVLYDSLDTPHNLSSVNAEHLLDAAPVDGNGVATGTSLSSTAIVFTHELFNSINNADNIILTFTLNSTDNKIVKISSESRIKFNTSLIFKPDINISLK